MGRGTNSIAAEPFPRRPDALDVIGRQGHGAAGVRPPPRRLGIDPDVFVGLFECRSQGGPELLGREVILVKLVRAPALFAPVVVHPQTEPGANNSTVSGR